jgi:hypothetical protein
LFSVETDDYHVSQQRMAEVVAAVGRSSSGLGRTNRRGMGAILQQQGGFAVTMTSSRNERFVAAAAGDIVLLWERCQAHTEIATGRWLHREQPGIQSGLELACHE